MRALLAALALITAAGCAAVKQPVSASSAAPAGAGRDTLRGIFVLEGSDPMPLAVLRTSDGRVALDDVPPDMRRLVQLDVWVRGTAEDAGRFGVQDFLVRGAGGQPAWDGTVARDADGFALRLPDGTVHALSGAPGAFAGLVGRRIWVVETSANTVATYGVIE
ncbi:MAG: hypothetical protein ACRENQ_11920 [Gemmatimonadaceae bacterium]